MRERLRVRVAGRELQVSHLDKVLWPGDGLTKGDLIQYLLDVAPYMLPHLRGRPLVCTRYPDGAAGPGFYQKDAPAGTPPWVPTWPYRSREGRVVRFILVEEPATLAWLGQLAAIELHPWLSRVDRPDYPDLLVFDLDPGPAAGFQEAVKVALVLRRVLAALGLEGYPKTSGATGLHVMVPIAPEHPYAVVTGFARRVAGIVRAELPHLVTTERTLARRPPGAVYLDFLQNGPGKTVVSVYGPRPRPGAPVSMPVGWEELERGVDPGRWTIRTAPARLRAAGDLYAPVARRRQPLGPALRALPPGTGPGAARATTGRAGARWPVTGGADGR